MVAVLWGSEITRSATDSLFHRCVVEGPCRPVRILQHFGGAWLWWPTVAFARSNLLHLGSCNCRLGKFDKVGIAGFGGQGNFSDSGGFALTLAF